MNRISTRAALFAIAALFVTLAIGCSQATSSSSGFGGVNQLYMTDTFSGNVYTYNPSKQTTSSSGVVTAASGAGTIRFFKGIGYIAEGYGGLYYFNPSDSVPTAKEVTGSGSLNTQYLAFYSSTKAYVSVAGSYSSDSGGVYSFNPSSLSDGMKQVASADSKATKYMQDIIVGPDSMIYVARNLDSSVIKIDPTTDAVTATYTTTAGGTTGLLSGTLNGTKGVFVANTYGSIDFIPENAADGSTAQAVVSGIYPGRLVQPSSKVLVATGYGHSYVVALSGSTGTATEVKAAGTSFGSFDIAYKDGLVYVPSSDYSGKNYLYVFTATGDQESYSPVSVMTSGDAITNIGFYED
jgi:hypothetical protein